MKVPFFVAESLLWTQEIKFYKCQSWNQGCNQGAYQWHVYHWTKLMKFTRYELITIWPTPILTVIWMVLLWLSLLTPSQPTYYFLWIFLWFLTQHPNPTSQSTPTTMAKQVFKGYGVGGTLPSPAPPSPRRETRLTLTFYVKTHWTNNNTAYQFYIGVMGQQEQSQVPCHPFRMQTRSPCSGERCFPNNFSQGGRATKDNNTILTTPLHGKSPDRLPRSIKVKNLTPQEKVKEWIQTLPPTRTATNEAILIISKTQTQVHLTIWGSYSFTLGWQGNNRHSCKGASPSLSFPYRETSKQLSSET